MSKTERSPLTADMVTAEWLEGDHEWTLFVENDGTQYVVGRRLLRGHFADLSPRARNQHLESARENWQVGTRIVFVTLSEQHSGIEMLYDIGPSKIVGIPPETAI